MFLKLFIFSALLAAASACFCMSTGNVNVRDQPCGAVIGSASAGQCFPDQGGRDSCFIDTTLWDFCQVDYNGQNAWIACDYMESSNPSACEPVTCGDVRLITREEWGARPPSSVSYLSLPLTMDFVHHSAGSSCTTQAQCEAAVRGIQDYHMDVNGWSDIGYNFLIGEDGNAYEGRGWDRQGAHASGWNEESHGFCVIGTFMTSLPNQAALNALQGMIDCGIAEGATVNNYKLHGHRDGVCTSCPGDTLYDDWVAVHSNYGGSLPGGCRRWEWGDELCYH